MSEVVFSQGLVKSCLLSGRVGIVSTAGIKTSELIVVVVLCW